MYHWRQTYLQNTLIAQHSREPCVLWGPRGLQAHGFESCPRSESRLTFISTHPIPPRTSSRGYRLCLRVNCEAESVSLPPASRFAHPASLR
ncbi:hypothetical protein E2C01_031607 [Portunus trituberculatus]|uniref:Uncharacterized protein n=1 Tax=Portunus trituberculatus TaxID=210409 RepID=A0A5B7EXB5_PORTR|nr:hypothetical protein [Portunus trituberculatus]